MVGEIILRANFVLNRDILYGGWNVRKTIVIFSEDVGLFDKG
jgi:hypothetical protein